MKADLHIHSNYSDGSDDISNLFLEIKKAGLEIFALTDHDTVAGCAEMSQIVSDGIKFIPSVELTCKADFVKCHILGYNCDYTNETLLKLIEKGKNLRKIKLETRINYLKNVWNIALTKEELDWLYSRKSVVKTHIANILVNRGLANDNVSAMKKEVIIKEIEPEYVKEIKSLDPLNMSPMEALNYLVELKSKIN